MGGQTFDAGEFFTIIPMAAQTEGIYVGTDHCYIRINQVLSK